MKIAVKNFEEITTKELYNILQLRAAVFVVEQNCAYQDLDGKDEKALHIIGSKNGDIVAYTRIFAPGDYTDKACIGRVVVKKDQRAFGYGKDIMIASIDAIRNSFKTSEICLSAQSYLTKFYKELGFSQVGEEYLEDGIPHIMMEKN
ncbi:GNAT family N-acetyltransferase [Muriicola sp. Z0-33]|uniref:GNAT family N-acetyltransferase n=1 Tax=Muriicola sp. Z0-33 TaxID=2816957 RepID=UPI00223882A2|nr:GNAT family N-acetyltransferase [Muriicola sp. Z0-33]MCW5514688.1 GNAT family N-acetyltransferase [Muriicola sp. Z0-33]